MQISRATTTVSQTDADAIVVGLFGNSPPSGSAAEVDRATGGLIGRLIEAKEFSGKSYEMLPLIAPPGIAARQVLVVGLGEEARFDAAAAFRCASAAARQLSAKPRKQVAFFLDACSKAAL